MYACMVQFREFEIFFGICNYYRKFFKGFSQLCDLTRKGAFEWIFETQSTFDKMKKVVSTCPILSLHDFSQPFILECDASSEGVGSVLMYNNHTVSYESHKLRGPELIYTI
jgi:uncharacterized Fe-S cluster protein YjdI